ncbi:MAG: hypothetical protein Q8900_12535 [Bacillota bacterium]|nr:hypothetical protein [Bacillota bacterium]
MNKIKVLYDVVKSMRKKEVINGVMNLEVFNGEAKVVCISNEFTKNTISGELKAKISKEINMGENKVKQETDTELNFKDHPFHKFHHEAHMNHRNKVSMILFMLNTLNNLTCEQKDDKIILTLDLIEVLKEGKELRNEFQKNYQGCEGSCEFDFHKHHEFIKKFLSADHKDAVLNVTVNKANEIEKIEVSANGENVINGSVNFI